jgi:general secretion pathway protein D
MAARTILRLVAIGSLAMVLTACTVAPPQPRPESPGHLGAAPPPAVAANIPEPVKRRGFVPIPVQAPPEETFTVVVNQVPVRELLFALARDANVNVDVHPEIEGNVTLNAIDQSLYQILDRISRQLDVRYENQDDTLVIVPDSAFLRTYRVDYVNVTRKSTGKIGASSSIEAAGEARFTNTSSSDIDSTSDNEFWQTLEASLDEIVKPALGSGDPRQKRVIVNRESGLVLVRATTSQHELVQEYLDQVIASATRQVLIEATIVEVELNDRYQAGINWQVFTRQGGLLGAGITLGADVGSAFTAGASGAVTGLIFDASDAPTGSAKRDVEVSISLLNEFGDTQVLSSPKVMALNNQPAILKVVDNEVYFEVTTDVTPGNTNTNATVSFDTDVRTVSVGLVMNVIPQVSESDNVTLNVRPTITRIREFVDDPAVPVALAQAGLTSAVNVANQVPVIQVRETESVMRVGSGQLAILGGLMQDRQTKDDESVPGASEVPAFGELFNFREREQTKTELVVFLRPTVIRTPDVGADLAGFRPFLPENLRTFERQKAPFVPLVVEEGKQQ